MNKYILINKKKLFAFDEDKGFTATFMNNVWGPSPVSFLALLAEKDENVVQINESEAMLLTGNNAPDEYFKNLQNKLLKR